MWSLLEARQGTSATVADVDPQDVLDGAGDDVSTGDPTFDEIGAEAARQLYARLQGGEKLPGTDLMKVVASYFKAKEEALRHQPAEEVTYTLVELLADVNLPAERKTELLIAERDHYLSQVALIEEALKE